MAQAFDAGSGKDQAIVLQLGTAPIVERALKIVGIERVLPRAHDREEALRIISTTEWDRRGLGT
jgi:hypothetical protein